MHANKEIAGQRLKQLLMVRVAEMSNQEPFLIHFIYEAKGELLPHSSTMTRRCQNLGHTPHPPLPSLPLTQNLQPMLWVRLRPAQISL